MNAKKLTILTSAILVALSATCRATAQPAYKFTEIVLPAASGYDFPGAWALNNNGTVVGNCNAISDFNISPGFIYERGVISILPPAPFAGGDPNPDDYQALGDPTGINDADTAVGWFTDATGSVHGFTYTADGEYTQLPDAMDGPLPGGWAAGINNQGDIVGAATGDLANGPWRGWVLHQGSYTLFDVPDAVATFPNGINDRGDIVGYYVDGDGATHGFLRNRNKYVTVDFPGAGATAASGINNLGQIVGNYSESGDLFSGDDHGFLLSNGVYSTQDFPGTSGNVLSGINDHGEVSGVYNEGLNAYFGMPAHGSSGH